MHKNHNRKVPSVFQGELLSWGTVYCPSKLVSGGVLLTRNHNPALGIGSSKGGGTILRNGAPKGPNLRPATANLGSHWEVPVYPANHLTAVFTQL